MKKKMLWAGLGFCLTMLPAVSMGAQPLPKIKLERVLPNLKMPPRPDWLMEGIQSVRPVWMSEAPDGSGRFFVVVQTGRILVVKKGSDGSDAKDFLNIEDRHTTFQNEDGLLGLAFHPGFKTNGLLYIYFTMENKPEDIKRLDNGLPVAFPYRSVISEFKVSANDPDKADMSSERVIFETLQPYWNHKGGELCFGPDGYLYFGLGDGGRGTDPFGNGQNTASFLGKMLRIDVNSRTTLGGHRWTHELQYGIPSDNPFVKEPEMGGVGAHREVYAYGFRNPWRWSFDRATGDLWVGDVGQDLWEEVDLVTKGGNYGWNVREGAHHFKPGPAGAQYIEPLMEYPHRPNLLPESLYPDHTIGMCIVGGYVYRGQKYPALQGIYIYGDFSLGTIWGFRYDREARKITDQSSMLEQPKNICSFAEDLDGELYALMDDGHIYQLTSQ
ncbi:MAG TPA: PQQ-dependent sugar dehydrogenase [Verrucomicrobiae bacterium]|jgi:glucose/arabinose dehydrogenase|nr:PQQ-dependent sugar dehydrogenase [Verrucomicrobiae bacterium]